MASLNNQPPGVLKEREAEEQVANFESFLLQSLLNYLSIECLVNNSAGSTICYANVNQNYCFQQNMTGV